MEHLFAEGPRDDRRRMMLGSPTAAGAALLHRNTEFASGHIGACWEPMNRPKIRRRASRITAVPAFPGPEHDHGHCSAQAIARAEALCAARDARLTPIRRQVLEVLADSHQPLGAYEVMDRLAGHGPRPAPITVYRALEFLVDNGLVHRIESRNAFLACINNHESGAPVVFLICERCGAVGESPSAEVTKTLATAAKRAGFTPKAPVIEITGVCSHCASI
jgi:Fur family zinc uptake transcriptional regulator